jgi:hypothetical protein
MSLSDNQTFSKLFKFNQKTDKENQLSINIIIKTNHDIPKNLIIEMEEKINSIIKQNYEEFKKDVKTKKEKVNDDFYKAR